MIITEFGKWRVRLSLARITKNSEYIFVFFHIAFGYGTLRTMFNRKGFWFYFGLMQKIKGYEKMFGFEKITSKIDEEKP